MSSYGKLPGSGGGGGGETFTAAGDLSGNNVSQRVIKINGATIPISGSLVTGNIISVSGANSLSYGPLNLAGGSNVVTGSLPVANLPDATTGAKGILRLAGDLGGVANTPTVSRINGATVPVGGSLTTGNILSVSGSGTLSYSPLNLSGGSNYITGTLPVNNLPDATISSKGIVQLAGDLGGTADNPIVTNFSIPGQTDYAMLYFNGSNWITLPAGTSGQYLRGGMMGNPTWQSNPPSGFGSIEVDFGPAPGTNIARAIVTDAWGVHSSSIIRVYIAGDSTDSHNSYEHELLASMIGITYSNIVDDVGFTIQVTTDLRLDGKLLIRWVWN